MTDNVDTIEYREIGDRDILALQPLREAEAGIGAERMADDDDRRAVAVAVILHDGVGGDLPAAMIDQPRREA